MSDRARVLIVDDERDIVDLLQDILVELGYPAGHRRARAPSGPRWLTTAPPAGRFESRQEEDDGRGSQLREAERRPA